MSGKSELQQLETSFTIKESDIINSVKTFKKTQSGLSYKLTSLNLSSICIAFLIQEVRLYDLRTKHVVKGGSGFHTIAESENNIAFCPYIDHKNDSYTILCPRYEQCAKVTSYLIFFDYLAYTGQVAYQPLNRIIFSRKFCNNDSHSFHPLPKVYWKKQKFKRSNQSLDIFPWYIQKKGEKMLTSSQVTACLKRNNWTAHFIGDSHSRNLAYYTYSVIGKLVGASKIHADIVKGNIKYTYGVFMLNRFLDSVRYVLSHSVNSNRSIVIANVGAWDITFNNLTYFAKVAVPAFRTTMHSMYKNNLFSDKNFIFFNIPPVPHRKYVNKRNSLAAAAGNRLLSDALTGINITVLEYFELARMFINDTAPNDIHYLFTNDTGSYGSVGIAIANYFLQEMCKKISK